MGSPLILFGGNNMPEVPYKHKVSRVLLGNRKKKSKNATPEVPTLYKTQADADYDSQLFAARFERRKVVRQMADQVRSLQELTTDIGKTLVEEAKLLEGLADVL